MGNNKATYTLQIDAEISGLEKKLGNVKGLMSNVLGSAQAPKGMEKTFEKVENLLDQIRSKASQPIDSKNGFTSINKDIGLANVALSSLVRQIDKLSSASESAQISFLPPEQQKAINTAISAVDKYDKAIISAATETKELIGARERLVDIEQKLAEAKADQAFKEGELEKSKAEAQRAQEAIDAINARKAALAELRQEQEKIEKFYNTPNEDGTKKNKSKKYDGVSMRPQDIKKKIASLESESSGDAEALIKETDALKKAKASWDSYIKTVSTAERTVTKLTQEHTEITQKVQALTESFKNSSAEQQQAAFAALRAEADKLGVSLDGIGEEFSEADSNELVARLQALKDKGLSDFAEQAKKASKGATDLGKGVDKLGDEVKQSAEEFKTLSEEMQRAQEVENKIKSFLGLTGATQLLKAALRDAMSTIKELDATMTEMAVVTDLGVGDYWDQLPEYSQRASDLGVSINSAYKAATLYYQQGLKTNEVNAISAQTLKMAKISGLDAATATDKMTAALRGFNMELNETSAQRVADVYSELAAITAADVKEISSAMSKTASIASSAGMEFETTAAFLSQIIETTRESAETAGTALKTVIARFQELKKDPAEIGEVDGEVVDANKIETALRSVGVALRDSSGQFRDLDDVFMELSSKWNTLDTNTQRYIATIAAGSRQQSRFIAMMQDYGRTQELVSAANNSTGASNKQFEKTMDSLEAKIAKLENAWHEFSMGIMNSDLVKLGVDILTKFLEIINKATSGLKGLGGSVTKVLTIITAFKLGKSIFEKLKAPIKSFFAEIIREAGITGEQAGKAAIDGVNKAKNTNAGAKTVTKTAKERFEESPLPDGYKMAKDGSIRNAKGGFITKEEQQRVKEQRKANFAKENLPEGYSIDDNGKIHDKAGKYITQEEEQVLLAEPKKTPKEYVSDAFGTAKTKLADKGKQSGMGKLKRGISKLQNEKKLKDAVNKKSKATTGSNEYKQAEKDIQDATKALDGFKQEQEALGEQGATAWTDIGAGIQAAGQAITGVGMGVSMLGGLFDQLGLTALGDAFSTVGNILVVLGGAVSTFGSIFTAVAAACSAAGVSLQAAFWPILVVGLIILAVVMTLVAIFAIINAIAAQSPAAKLEAAAAAAERASAAADAAANSYQNLADALDGLKDKYSALDGLVEGTEEWNNAVNDVNQSVLDLIDQYPELAGLVENEGGVLKLDLDSKEVKAVLNDYKKNAVMAKGAELGAKAQVAKAEKNVAFSELSDKAQVGYERANARAAGAAAPALYLNSILPIIGTAIAVGVGEGVQEAELENTRDDTDQVAQALANGEITGSKEDIYEYLMDNFDYASEEAQAMAVRLSENADELRKYGNSVEAADAQMEAYYDAMSMQAQSLIDLGKYSQEQVAQMGNVVDGDAMEGYIGEFADEYKNMSKDELNAAKEEYAKATYGEDAKVDGNKITYKDAEGVEQTAEFSGDEDWINAMAAASATEKAANAMEQVPGMLKNSAAVLEKSSQGAGDAFVKAMSSEKGLTKGELANLTGNIDTKDLRDAWESLSDEQKEIYNGDFLTYVQNFTDAIAENEKAFAKAEKAAEELGITLNDKLSASAAQAWTQNLEKLAVGGADVSGFNDALNSVLAGLTPEQAESFMAQLNATDFSSIDAWDAFEETIKELNLPVTDFENFVTVAKETSNAIKKVDFSTLNDQLNSTFALIDKINNSSTRNFSEEDYKEIIASNKSLEGSFRKVGDQYVFVGGSMDLLTDALHENTEATMDAANKQLDFLVGAGEIIAQDQNITGDVNSMDADQLREYLDSNADKVVAAGYDLSQFGITGLTNQTDFSQITDTNVLKEMANAFYSAGNNVDYNKQQQAKTLEEANITNYINQNSASQNASFAAQGGDQAKAHGEALITQAAMSGGVSDALIAQYREALDAANAEGATDEDKAKAAELGEIIAARTEETLEENANKESYTDLVSRLTEAIYNARQEEIDKLGEVNESINDAKSAMVDKIQKQIDASRQERENEKTEKNISDMQQKRAYLMADSSGANQLELMDLDAQIADAEQSYQDSLVDQALQQLQDSNEEAAKQREKQIELMQAQLDSDSERGLIANEAAQIAKTSIDDIKNGVAPLETAMGQLLWQSEGKGLGGLEKEAWVSQLNQTAVTAEKYLTQEEKKENAPGVTAEGTTAVEGENPGGARPEDALVAEEMVSNATPVLSAWEQFKQGFVNFFTVDIPNWWNTYIAPFFTAEFWQTQWQNITDWWDTTIAPIFTAEFWSEKFTQAGVAVGEFIKSIIDAIASFGEKIGELVASVQEWFFQLGVNIGQWWKDNLAKYFTKEFWTEQWNNIVAGAKDMWHAFVSFFTNTIPKWWNEKIAPMFTKEYWKEKWDSFVQGLVVMWEKIQNFFKEKILPIFTKEYWVNLMAKIGEGLKTGFEAAINAVIKGINWALKGLADIYNASIGSFISGIASVFGGKDVGKITYKEIPLVKFKEGGIANFTGPAWLDGTKSKPEAVLNAKDTENFIALKDVLADVMDKKLFDKGQGESAGGDNIFEIDIHVEKLENDYDVEQLADKIRRMIYEDASYRNVNAVSFIR